LTEGQRAATLLAVTLGDPAGIGPEIIAAAWSTLRATGPAFLAVGDAATIAAAGCAVRRVTEASEA
jgi:4-hydroxythreonine-4-phosphate dehydrogenase